MNKWLKIGIPIVVGFIGWVFVDLMSSESVICELPVAQPGLSDACAAADLGGRPSEEERLAWEAIPAGQCSALRAHVEAYPDGAYRDDAAELIATRRVENVETWRERTVVLPLYSPLNLEPIAPDEAEDVAMRSAEARATGECENLARNEGFRLLSAAVGEPQISCETIGGGAYCSVEGQSLCSVEVRAYSEVETCG